MISYTLICNVNHTQIRILTFPHRACVKKMFLHGRLIFVLANMKWSRYFINTFFRFCKLECTFTSFITDLKTFILYFLVIFQNKMWKIFCVLILFLNLTAHNRQKLKSKLLTCHCHKFNRIEAVGLSTSILLKKYDCYEYAEFGASLREHAWWKWIFC